MKGLLTSWLIVGCLYFDMMPAAHGQDTSERLLPSTLERLLTSRADKGLTSRDIDELAANPVETGVGLLLRAADASNSPTSEQRSILFQLLENLGAKTEAYLVRDVTAASPLAQRALAIEIYGRIGNHENLAQVVELAVGTEAGPTVEEETYRLGVAGIIERNIEILRISKQLLGLSDSRFHPALVDAIGGFEHHDALDGLASLLGNRDNLDARILRAMGDVAMSLRAPFDERILDLVRPYLESREDGVRAEAIRTCGSLEDRDAVGTLIDLMESPGSSGERSNALSALASITKQTFRCHADTWRSWHGLQQTWWQEESTRALAALDGELPEAIGAINELLSHPLYRHDLADHLVPYLRDPREGLRPLVAIALGQLQSASAIPALLQELEEDPSLAYVRTALTQLERPR